MNAFQDDGAPAPARTETGASPNATGRERTTDTGKSTSLERTFDSPLAGALACGELDAPAFPLVASRKKVPAFKGWQAAATTDTGKLRGWAKRFPRCNFGVATEAAGLVVLDEDTPGDLAAWAESEGIDLPETFAVATGREGGGTHFWFHTAEVFKSSSPMKRAGFNVDVKARGAFVVAPGSVHKSGAVYRVVNDAPIADLPDALAAHLRRPSETAYEVEPPAEPLPDLVGRRYIDVALDGLRADLAEAAAAPLEAAPRWDPTVMHAAYRVVELSNLAPGVFTRADALRFLSEHAPTDSDFTSTNVELKFIHAATELGYTGGREKVAEKAEDVFGDLGPLDGENVRESGVLDDVRRRYPLKDFRALLDPDRPPRPWIVEDFWPAEGSVSLIAPAGVGKSLFALSLAVAVARGDEHFAGLPISERRRVLYVDWENGEYDYIERLTALGFTQDNVGVLDGWFMSLELPDALPKLDTAEGRRDLALLIDAYGLERHDLVVLDSAQRMVGGPENDSDTWRAFYDHTALMLKARGMSVLRMDNTGHQDASRSRGSSSKRDDVDVQWVIKPVKNAPAGTFDFMATKGRMKDGLPLLTFYRRSDDGFLRWETDRSPRGHRTDTARRWLDDHGAEAEWGQDRAWEFAKEHGCPYSRALVREAQQRRKADAQAALNDALEAFEGESE